MTEDEMVGWHHPLNGHVFGWTLGVGDNIPPSHPLSPPSPVALSLSQHQGLFPVTHFFTLGGRSIGASASVLPMNIQD